MIIVCSKLMSSSLYYEFYLNYTYLSKKYNWNRLMMNNLRFLQWQTSLSPTAKENDSQERKQIPYRVTMGDCFPQVYNVMNR